jgi:hypothetical protein
MTEEEYESLHAALVAAHKILPVDKDCNKNGSRFPQEDSQTRKSRPRTPTESGGTRKKVKQARTANSASYFRTNDGVDDVATR